MKFIYRKLILILIVVYFVICNGCNIINPAEIVPTYFHIDSFQVTTNIEYSSISYSHKIPNVWVYYNGNVVGVYDLPATFPIMAKGNGTLSISPGIQVDGLSSELKVYPFYTVDTLNFDAQPGKTIQHNPKVTYYNKLNFRTLMDQYNLGFEQNGGTTGIAFVSDVNLEFEPPKKCAGIILNTVNDSSIVCTTKTFPIPSGPAFIEFNYYSTVPFYLGLQAFTNGATSEPYYLTGVYPNNGWGKFYLDVGSFNAKYQGNLYKLYIKAAVPAGQSNGRLLLDNIELVSF